MYVLIMYVTFDLISLHFTQRTLHFIMHEIIMHTMCIRYELEIDHCVAQNIDILIEE